jgi:hypothetical protein
MSDETAIEWEVVYTVHDYFDGPRNGIADYNGAPHAYKCEWDDTNDDWSRVFRLSPINDEQFSAVKEGWSIWLRYQKDFHANALQTGDTHPALAVDRERHEQLRDIVEAALEVVKTGAVMAIPEFRGSIEPNYDLKVRWLPEGNVG